MAEINAIEFTSFRKIPRWNRRIIVTEKIDGTNACVRVDADGDVIAGSRTRWITPENDNFGFAAWVRDHRDELATLGEGLHYGEWWGAGIQRRYGLTEKRFSLFNTSRWGGEDRPKCCFVVPVLWDGIIETDCFSAEAAILELKRGGSVASPGFMQPEGIVIFHVASNIMFKMTIEKDAEPKGISNGR